MALWVVSSGSAWMREMLAMGNEFDQISALPFFAPYAQTWHDETNLEICLGFDIEAHLNC